MSKKSCWSWRYRVRFGPMNRLQYNRLYKACLELFVCDFTHPLNRWDITSVPRGNYYLGERWHDRVAVHFKYREDLVLFKFCYDMVK